MTRLDIVKGYETLASVLDAALAQAQSGKGRERHARGQCFEKQPIVTISQLLGTSDGDLYQAIKKLQESQRLSLEAAIKERLGAINYIAASIIVDVVALGLDPATVLSAPFMPGAAQHDPQEATRK